MTDVESKVKSEDTAENGHISPQDRNSDDFFPHSTAFQAPQARMMTGGGAGAGDGKRAASPVDSEAETEILAQSQQPTPIKPIQSKETDNPRKRKASADGSADHNGSRSDIENGEDDDDEDSDLDVSHRRRKTAKIFRANGNGARSQSPPYPQQTLRHAHRRASSQHSPLSLVEPGRRLRRRRQTSEDQSEQEATNIMAKDKKGLDHSGRTRLARACNDGDFEIARSILEEGLQDLDRPDYANNTPLQMAAVNGHLDIIQLLVKKGANVNNVNMDGDTPYKDAEDNGFNEVVQFLVDHGADPSLAGKKQGARERLLYANITSAALLSYCKDGDVEGIGHCLEGGVKPTVNCTVAAALGGHVEALNLLLAYGGQADPDPNKLRGEDDQTPMLAAISAGKVMIVKTLLDRDDVDSTRLVGGRDYITVARERRRRNWQDIIAVLEADRNKGASSDGDGTSGSTASPSKIESTTESTKVIENGDDKQSAAEAERARARAEAEAAAEAARIKQEEEESARVVAQAEAERAARAEEERKAKAEAERKRVEDEIKRAEEERKRVAEEKARAEEERRALEAQREIERQKARQAYLAAMPRALAKMLEAGPVYPIKKPSHWHRGLEHLRRIYTFTLGDLDPTITGPQANELYMAGWQASVLLGHSRLDEIKVQGLLKMTGEQREMLFRRLPMHDYITIDAHWALAPPEEQARSGIEITMLKPGVYHTNWDPIYTQSQRDFMNLPDDQVVWVPFEEFNKLAQQSDRLCDFKYSSFQLNLPTTSRDDFKGGYCTSKTPIEGIGGTR